MLIFTKYHIYSKILKFHENIIFSNFMIALPFLVQYQFCPRRIDQKIPSQVTYFRHTNFIYEARKIVWKLIWIIAKLLISTHRKLILVKNFRITLTTIAKF
uniref:(northern house mosquito) hypothetical protein n=1 Tax=Culex pipiens TaxID=7175 RepID=A0A8D8APP5_CULPI